MIARVHGRCWLWPRREPASISRRRGSSPIALNIQRWNINETNECKRPIGRVAAGATAAVAAAAEPRLAKMRQRVQPTRRIGVEAVAGVAAAAPKGERNLPWGRSVVGRAALQGLAGGRRPKRPPAHPHLRHSGGVRRWRKVKRYCQYPGYPGPEHSAGIAFLIDSGLVTSANLKCGRGQSPLGRTARPLAGALQT